MQKITASLPRDIAQDIGRDEIHPDVVRIVNYMVELEQLPGDIDHYLLNCSAVTQDEREYIMESIGSQTGGKSMSDRICCKCKKRGSIATPADWYCRKCLESLPNLEEMFFRIQSRSVENDAWESPYYRSFRDMVGDRGMDVADFALADVLEVQQYELYAHMNSTDLPYRITCGGGYMYEVLPIDEEDYRKGVTRTEGEGVVGEGETLVMSPESRKKLIRELAEHEHSNLDMSEIIEILIHGTTGYESLEDGHLMCLAEQCGLREAETDGE